MPQLPAGASRSLALSLGSAIPGRGGGVQSGHPDWRLAWQPLSFLPGRCSPLSPSQLGFSLGTGQHLSLLPGPQGPRLTWGQGVVVHPLPVCSHPRETVHGRQRGLACLCPVSNFPAWKKQASLSVSGQRGPRLRRVRAQAPGRGCRPAAGVGPCWWWDLGWARPGPPSVTRTLTFLLLHGGTSPPRRAGTGAADSRGPPALLSGSRPWACPRWAGSEDSAENMRPWQRPRCWPAAPGPRFQGVCDCH